MSPNPILGEEQVQVHVLKCTECEEHYYVPVDEPVYNTFCRKCNLTHNIVVHYQQLLYARWGVIPYDL